MSPKITTELAEGIEPLEGHTYFVTEVEETKTAVQAFTGYRTGLEPTKRKAGDDSKYATMLWKREQAGVSSKLGSFMSAFLDFYGDEDTAFDTDNWIGCTVRIVKWAPKQREVEVIEGKPK